MVQCYEHLGAFASSAQQHGTQMIEWRDTEYGYHAKSIDYHAEHSKPRVLDLLWGFDYITSGYCTIEPFYAVLYCQCRQENNCYHCRNSMGDPVQQFFNAWRNILGIIGLVVKAMGQATAHRGTCCFLVKMMCFFLEFLSFWHLGGHNLRVWVLWLCEN